MKVSDREAIALAALCTTYEPGWCLGFDAIARRSGLSRDKVRRTVRALARKGLAEFHRGLFTEDGLTAGSGYCASSAGYALAKTLNVTLPEGASDV